VVNNWSIASRVYDAVAMFSLKASAAVGLYDIILALCVIFKSVFSLSVRLACTNETSWIQQTLLTALTCSNCLI